MIEGRYVTEAAWVSPIWFSYDADAVPPKETADTASSKPKGGETGETGSPETGTPGETGDTAPRPDTGDLPPPRRFCFCGSATGWPSLVGLLWAVGWVARRRRLVSIS